MRGYERWQGAILGAIAFLAYALTLAKQVIGGDNGEFATLYATGGVAHPPGFPLYVLWLRAFSWLPAATPAAGAALATALASALSVFLLHHAARTLGASPRTSGFFAAVYAFSPLAWQLGSSAEVFSLNVALALGIVILASPDGPLRGEKRALALALVAGLGLSNHHSIVLTLPVGICGLFLAFREGPRLRVVFLGLAGLALGLTPYLDLYRRATHASFDSQWVWGNVHDARSLLAHFLRREYGTTSLGLANQARDPIAQNLALGRYLLSGLLGLPLLALAGAAVSRLRPRPIVLTLAGAFLLSGPVFVSLFNLAPRGLGAVIVERFYLLPSALLCLLGALAAEAVIAAPKPWHLTWALGPIAVSLATVLPEIAEHNRPTIGLYVQNVLSNAPKDLVILGSGDHRLGAFEYANKALDQRRDVVFVSAHLLLAPWYRKQTSDRLGISLPDPQGSTLHLREVVSALLASGRPVALTGLLAPGLTDGFSTYPIGPLIRVLPPGMPPPDPEALEAENRVLYQKLEIEARPPERDTFPATLHEDYARPWLTLAQVHESRGLADRAIACRNEAQRLAPWTLAAR
jgi:hypothetical protein